MKSARFPLPQLAGMLVLPCLMLPSAVRAAELLPSGNAAWPSPGTQWPSSDYFSYLGVGLSGTTGVVGAAQFSSQPAAAQGIYLFRNLDNAAGTTTESGKLTPSGNAPLGNTGSSVSISGNIVLAGSAWSMGRTSGNPYNSTAYLFRDLDTATGTVTESAKLTPSNSAVRFAASVSLSGTSGLVGAYMNAYDAQEEAYLFRNLDTASGTVTETAKLTRSNNGYFTGFGGSVSLEGSKALIAASGSNVVSPQVYLYRGLDTATGTVTESATLAVKASRFGSSVSLSGNAGLVGAGDPFDLGEAYLFRNLDTVAGVVTQADVKLTASTRTMGSAFGQEVRLSGNTALVGAPGSSNKNNEAYLFTNLGSAGGTITETVKLTASSLASGGGFGGTIALDGDNFIIGAVGAAYSGRVSAFTTLDEGGATRSTDGLSFVSQDHWVIGKNTGSNQLVLSAGDSGMVTASGKKVIVGQNAGADLNSLTVNGSLTANTVLVGGTGNNGNALRVGRGGIVTTTGGVIVALGSSVGGDGTIKGDLRFSASSFFEFATSNTLTVNGSVLFDGSFGVTNLIGLDQDTPEGIYTLIDGTATNFAASGLSNWGEANAYDLGGGKSAWFEAGSLRLVVVPEADTALLVLLAGTSAALRRRSSRRRLQSV